MRPKNHKRLPEANMQGNNLMGEESFLFETTTDRTSINDSFCSLKSRNCFKEWVQSVGSQKRGHLDMHPEKVQI